MSKPPARQSNPPSQDVIDLTPPGSEARRRLEAWVKYGNARLAAEALGLAIHQILNTKNLVMKRAGVICPRQRTEQVHHAPTEQRQEKWDCDLAGKLLMSAVWPIESGECVSKYQLGGNV